MYIVARQLGRGIRAFRSRERERERQLVDLLYVCLKCKSHLYVVSVVRSPAIHNDYMQI